MTWLAENNTYKKMSWQWVACFAWLVLFVVLISPFPDNDQVLYTVEDARPTVILDSLASRCLASTTAAIGNPLDDDIIQTHCRCVKTCAEAIDYF